MESAYFYERKEKSGSGYLQSGSSGDKVDVFIDLFHHFVDVVQDAM